jgi:tRNA(Ile)-lysidine synthase
VVLTAHILSSLCDALPLRLGIAVSGGADSMALLGLLIEQQAQTPRILYVMTVDHALRAESADEARMVHDYCAAHGIAHITLRWDHAKPQSGLQQKARQARRDLLIAACHEHGIADLVLAHQADDQLETFLQRLSRGAGLSGLRGMRDDIRQEGITLHRPLLTTERDVLRQYCHDQAIPFVDDPSNDDTQFERVRWRGLIKTLRAERADFVPQFLRSQKRLVDADDALQILAERWIAEHIKQEQDKRVGPRLLLSAQPQALIVYILRQMMITDKSYQVDLERLEAWVAQFCADDQADHALTLDQWWLRAAGNKVTLQKAPARRVA